MAKDKKKLTIEEKIRLKQQSKNLKKLAEKGGNATQGLIELRRKNKELFDEISKVKKQFVLMLDSSKILIRQIKEDGHYINILEDEIVKEFTLNIQCLVRDILSVSDEFNVCIEKIKDIETKIKNVDNADDPQIKIEDEEFDFKEELLGDLTFEIIGIYEGFMNISNVLVNIIYPNIYASHALLVQAREKFDAMKNEYGELKQNENDPNVIAIKEILDKIELETTGSLEDTLLESAKIVDESNGVENVYYKEVKEKIDQIKKEVEDEVTDVEFVEKKKIKENENVE